jgi:hypothetical protein
VFFGEKMGRKNKKGNQQQNNLTNKMQNKRIPVPKKVWTPSEQNPAKNKKTNQANTESKGRNKKEKRVKSPIPPNGLWIELKQYYFIVTLFWFTNTDTLNDTVEASPIKKSSTAGNF